MQFDIEFSLVSSYFYLKIHLLSRNVNYTEKYWGLIYF